MAFALPSCISPPDGFSLLQGHSGNICVCSSQLGPRLQQVFLPSCLRARAPKPLQRVEAVAERSRTSTVPAKAEDWPAVPSSQPQQPSDTEGPPLRKSRRAAPRSSSQQSEPKQDARRGRPLKATLDSVKLFATPEVRVGRASPSEPAPEERPQGDPQKRRRQRARPSRSPTGAAPQGQPIAASSASTQEGQVPKVESARASKSQASQRNQQYQSRTPDRPVSAVRRQRSLSTPPAPEVAAIAQQTGPLTPDGEKYLCSCIQVRTPSVPRVHVLPICLAPALSLISFDVQ